jgi:uncharacterized membrane protein
MFVGFVLGVALGVLIVFTAWLVFRKLTYNPYFNLISPDDLFWWYPCIGCYFVFVVGLGMLGASLVSRKRSAVNYRDKLDRDASHRSFE